MRSPAILGLTGSIGMGKSTVASMFAARGVPVFDADAQVRALQGPGGALLPEIESEFPGTTGPVGLDRDALGKLVFAEPNALARLEAIVHPAVAEKRAQFVAQNSAAPMIVFDIPLLFEKGGHESVDKIIVVSAPADVQRERVLARDGMSAQKFEHILTLQVPDAEKQARADHIIDTSGTLAETRAQVDRLIETLKDSYE